MSLALPFVADLSTLGLSPDFVVVNPIGFFCLALWSWGAFFSPTARREYAERHDGHYPQVSVSDLVFSAHALLLSSITFLQVWYYHRATQKLKAGPALGEVRWTGREETPLLAAEDADDGVMRAPTTMSLAGRVCLALIAVSALWELAALNLGRIQLLDFLYYASSVKLVITVLKYLPQMVLHYAIKSTRGFSIGAIFCDLTGGVFSLLQLVIQAVCIDGQPAGIWANPAKLGLSLLTLGFDLIFIFQRYALYPVSPRA